MAAPSGAGEVGRGLITAFGVAAYPKTNGQDEPCHCDKNAGQTHAVDVCEN